MLIIFNKQRLVLMLGLAGIAGTILTIISDLILIGKPGSGFDYFRLGTELMTDIPQWRITTGAFLGILVLPLQIVGLAVLYYGIIKAGKTAAIGTLLPLVHALIMGVAFHTCYAFLGTGWKFYYEQGLSSTAAQAMMSTYRGYWKTLIFIMVAEIILSSAFFSVYVAKGYSLFPRWMSILNPFCIFLVMFLLVNAIPAPFGGFAGSVYFNVSSMIFLILSTITVYKKIMPQR